MESSAYPIVHRGGPDSGGEGHGLVRVPLAGGRREVVVGWGEVHYGDAPGSAIAADATHLYYNGPETLMRKPLSGAPPEPLGSLARLIAPTRDNIYVSRPSGIERIARRTNQTRLLHRVPPGAPSVVALAADGEHVFWIERLPSPPVPTAYGLWRMRADGSEKVELATGTEDKLALDEQNVYWTARVTTYDELLLAHEPLSSTYVLAMPKNAEVQPDATIAE